MGTMDFTPPPGIEELTARIREFVVREVEPLEPEVLARGFGPCKPALDRLRARVKELGLFAPHVPKEHGGLGLSILEFAFVAEALARSPIAHYAFNCQAPDAGNIEILVRHGTPAQKERWLAPLVSGDIRSCFSMTEPERAGSNPTWLETRAILHGNEWVIDGHKWFTTSADGAAFAIVMAITDPDAPPHLRASQIIVPTDTPGFRLVRNIPVMGHAGSGWDSHAEIRYEGCRVPKESLLGPRGHGFLVAQERLGPGRIHHAMRWIGISERAFEMMCRRAASREVAPGEMLGDKQAVQTWIADARAEIHAARLVVLHAAWAMDRRGAEKARDEISMAKFFVADVLTRVLDRAIQVHGALGMTDDTPLAWFYRQERAAHIYDGPDEVHRAVVAKRSMKAHAARSR